MTDIATEFVLLRAGDALPVDEQVLTREIRDVGPWRCRIALDANGHRHLLVDLGEEECHADHSSRGISLDVRELVVEGETRRFADLHCRIPALDLVFERFVDDVIRRLGRHDASSVARTCRAVLADWRSLLESATRPLSRDVAVGLTGELVVLGLLKGEPAEVLSAWRGPEALTHDFARKGGEIEVKATSSVDGNYIKISNIDQLDPSGTRPLHLVVIHLREETGGLNLDERIRGLLEAGMPRDDFLRKVEQAGYVYESGTAAEWVFSVRSVRVWHVDDAFPGLRRGDVADRLHGVSKVRYELALDAATKPLATDEGHALLANWIGAHE